MNILLVNPPNFNHIRSVLPDAVESKKGISPPLGLLYVAGYLKKYSPQMNVKIIDCPAEQATYEQLACKIKSFSPDVVGVTAMSFTLLDALKTAKITKRINSGTKVVFGGPHVNIFGNETLGLGNIDYIVLGEGEKVFNELILNINDENALKKIRGLLFIDSKNNYIDTGTPLMIKNLDKLPLPARNLINKNNYYSVLSGDRLFTTIITSRGCPYKCLFCDRPHLGKTFRSRSAESVIAEIEDCREMGIKEFLFYDDTFTVDKGRVIDICNLIIKRNIKIKWDIRARVSTMDSEMIGLLKKAGCVRIHYGVESGSQKVLDILRKGTTIDRIMEIFKLTKIAGIETLAYFMIGNPGETRADIEKTIDFAKKLDPDYVHITITLPFPATDLYRLGIKRGIIKNDAWQEFALCPRTDFEPPIWEEVLTAKELRGYVKKAYLDFYFRPRYIIKRLFAIRSFRELAVKAAAGINLLRI